MKNKEIKYKGERAKQFKIKSSALATTKSTRK